MTAQELMDLATWVEEHLPRRAARVLASESQLVSQTVCQLLRDAVDGWERDGVVLDPVAFDAVLTAMTCQLTALTSRVAELTFSNAYPTRAEE